LSTARITPSASYISGWKLIAAALDVTANTAVAYSRLPEDPLPVRMRRGTPRIHSGHLEDWKRRRAGDPELEKIRGWRNICLQLGGADLDTAARWAKLTRDRLPVHGVGTRSPWAYASAVRDWVLRGDVPFQAHDRAAPTAVSRSATPKKKAAKIRAAA
jgi:hypothetical protein